LIVGTMLLNCQMATNGLAMLSCVAWSIGIVSHLAAVN